MKDGDITENGCEKTALVCF